MRDGRVNFDIAKRKGKIAEDFVAEQLQAKGYDTWQIKEPNKPHLIDGFTNRKDGVSIIAYDVKCKAEMFKYYAQGINTKHYDTYKEIMAKHHIHVFLFFVDENAGEVKYAKLSDLDTESTITDKDGEDREYPWVMNGNIRLFTTKKLKPFCKIPPEVCEAIKQANQRNYDY
jgi:hypothetical protein